MNGLFSGQTSILTGCPYSFGSDAAESVAKAIEELGEHVNLLRGSGKLSDATVAAYYQERKFEQVAESNAIEGSTLSLGETELAILQGVTITGHDPGFSRDARSLFLAVERIAELARDRAGVTDISTVRSIHELVTDGRTIAGRFRREPVRIGGSSHRPPKTWPLIMDAMEAWESWSLQHPNAPPILRASVLSAWLVHIHPFLDGNGRTSRAIANLELIRAGYPPIVIRRKDKPRYLEALRHSDEGGDLAPYFDLIRTRAGHSLLDLERAATREQGYSAIQTKVRQRQSQRLAVWTAAVRLLVERISEQLEAALDGVQGSFSVRWYEEELDLDDYLRLCEGEAVARSWVVELVINVPGLAELRRLMWAGYRSLASQSVLGGTGEKSPALFWSEPNPLGYPPWRRLSSDCPGACELTLSGDAWVLCGDGARPWQGPPLKAARRIVEGLLNL